MGGESHASRPEEPTLATCHVCAQRIDADALPEVEDVAGRRVTNPVVVDCEPAHDPVVAFVRRLADEPFV